MRGPSCGPRAKRAMSHHPCQIKIQLGRSDWSFRLLAETPQLKPLGIDCFLDRIAGEVIGRSAVWPDRAGGGPGTWFCGSVLPARSPAKARKCFLVSDLKM